MKTSSEFSKSGIPSLDSFAAIADKRELPPDDRIPAYCGPSYLSNSFSPHRPGAEGLVRKRLRLRLYVRIHIGLRISPSVVNPHRLYCTLTGTLVPALTMARVNELGAVLIPDRKWLGGRSHAHDSFPLLVSAKRE